MGGLAAAGAIAPHFEQVVVLERDALLQSRRTAREFPRGSTPTDC
jgi:hypothetical protein